MRSTRGFLAVSALLLLPVLAGCGDDNGGGGDDSPPRSSTPDQPESSSPGGDSSSAAPEASDAPESTAATAGPGSLPAACDVLTSEEVAAAFGVPFGPAESGAGGHTVNDIEWQTDNCDWEAEDLLEVQLGVAGPDDFTGDDEFTCPEPRPIASTVTPVPGLGDSAWWELDKNGPLDATLRVCTASYIFDIDLEYEDGVDYQGDPQQQAIALAGVVLGKLG